MKLRVLTLSAEETAQACRRLENLCCGLKPDLVVAIAEGGTEVADKIFPVVPHCQIGSRHRRRLLKGRWLSAVPVEILDFLRVAELLMRRKRHVNIPELSGNLKAKIENARRILVIDDAVDSGATLQAAVSVIKTAAPAAEVRTAVLTTTRRNPIVTPDYRCFPEGTILRFPWSQDAKK